MGTLRHSSILLLSSVMLFGCALGVPANPTPTVVPLDVTLTDTPAPPTMTFTATLRPTVTQAATTTPRLPTPIPLNTQGSSSTGGGAFAAGSSGGGSGGGGSASGVAPIGIRETATRIIAIGQGASASGSSNTISATAVPVGGATPTLTPPSQITERFVSVLAANDVFVLSYDIQMAGGTLVIWVVAPDGELVWIEQFNETVKSTAEIPVSLGGTYEIFTYAINLNGFYGLGFGTT